jgi:ketosteroid isomerase-like protein
MRRWFAGLAGVVLVTGLVTARQALPPDLAAMADTEREFAKTATMKGWRDAFLDFFADDAIAFAPDVILAKDRLRKQPSRPPSEVELIWEPRTGDVAASGELGWLTGPSTSINHTAPDAKPGYGCYLSVWRKQPDGRWRVFIDVGAGAPEAVPFAPGFNRIAFADRYKGSDGKDAAGKALSQADVSLNGQLEAQGLSKAFAPLLTPAARFHRPGSLPIVGRDAITKWLDENASSGTASAVGVEASAAGDFGYTHGRFTISAPKPLTGVYVRLWSRDASGRWWLVADVAQPFK